MLSSFRARNYCELEAKFIQDRLNHVEKNLSELCQAFSEYSRKAARLRDKSDELSKLLQAIAEAEPINRSLNVGLENLADSLSLIGDYGEARVANLDAKVVQPFARYDDICRSVKEEVKVIYVVRDKEVNKKRQLDRIRERNPRSRQQIVQAETDLVKSTAEVAKSVHHVEEKTTNFEKQKLHDLKSILLDFISTEIGYHAKAIEILSKAFNDVNIIDEESDLQEFKKSLRLPETIPHDVPRTNKGFFHSAHSLSALFSSNKQPPGIPHDTSRKFSKSEETLDSIKHSFSEDSDDTSSDEETRNDESVSKASPIVVRKFRK